MKTIELTQGKVTLVDDEDYDFLMQWKWHAMIKKEDYRYAARRKNKKVLIMHRVIMNATDIKIAVDHKDHDGLNNQKSNLRLCINAQNICNRRTSIHKSSSKYLGVYLSNWAVKKWKAQITKNNQKFFLGHFDSEEDAACAYDAAAKRLHGEFANLNFKNG